MEKIDFTEYIENTIWRRTWMGETKFEQQVIEDLKSGDYWRCDIWFQMFNACTRTFGGNLHKYTRITHFVPDIDPFTIPQNSSDWFDYRELNILEDFFEWERKHNKCHCNIHIKKSVNNLYVVDTTYSYSIGGAYSTPGIWNKTFETAIEAFEYGKNHLYDQLKRQGERTDTSKKDRQSINHLINMLLNLKWDRWNDKPLEGIKPPEKRNYLEVEIETGEKKDESPQLSLF